MVSDNLFLETVKNNWVKIRAKYSSVVFIAIPRDEPVLVFKSWGGSFRHVMAGPYELPDIVDDCVSYWKGRFYENQFPEVVQKRYGEKFNGLVKLGELKEITHEVLNVLNSDETTEYSSLERIAKTEYNRKNFPRGVFEVRLSFFSGTCNYHANCGVTKKQFQLTKDALRRCGFLEERRGKNKRLNDIAKERKKFVVEAYRDYVKVTGKKKPLPLNRLHKKWMDKVNQSGWSEKYYFSEMTIRRDIENYIKK